jgi:two-component system sensor histidine kinase/response regulator
MQRFAKDCQGWSARLEKALVDGELAVAERQVHTLKGLAGTFAMADLQMVLLELETAIKSGILEPRSEIARAEGLLGPLRAALANLPERCSRAPAIEDLDSSTSEVLAVLRQQLSEGDGEAEELWRVNRKRLAERFSPRQIAAIDHALANWDLDEALAVLNGTTQYGGGQ